MSVELSLIFISSVDKLYVNLTCFKYQCFHLKVYVQQVVCKFSKGY